MKKSIVFFVAGALFATVGSAYAEDVKSLVGLTKKIQAEVTVKVDGEKADKAGIIIDGTTYLPVRSIGNALGMNVSYSKTEVELTSKGESKMEPTTETPSETKQMSQEDIDTIKRSEDQIVQAEIRIKENKERITRLESERKVEEVNLETQSDKYERQLIEMKIGSINAEISGARDIIKMDEGAIESMKAYINKVKSKYE